MTLFLNDHRILGDLPGELARLEALTTDLRFLAQGFIPDQRHLAAAPVIDSWAIQPRSLPALVGIVGGHPYIPDRCPAMTSPIEIFAPGHGWARTGNTMYRLGTKADARPAYAN